MKNSFDLIVIGGGHAGLEAVWMAHQFDLEVALISLPDVPLGNTPCNPSIGGVGKGQVVREIDALGGLMGRLADEAGIHYKTLNESKGYAVHSTRAQVDKELYHQFAIGALNELDRLVVVSDKALSIRKDVLFHVELAGGKALTSKALILTVGTFLGGKLHTGPEQKLGGAHGFDQAPPLGELFKGIKALQKRFKTGTPARLKRSTINWDALEPQPSEEGTENFHWTYRTTGRKQPQISCYLTRTNERTLETIRSAKERSPLYNGQIQGVGPRYCPSIEDKAFRYPDRNVHHVFLEPEGLLTESVYPNGLSTSLPKDVQEDFIHSIEGLEKAEILVHGYAVEYDVVDTTTLRGTLEHKEIEGLYFAGQVNGTSGYEEAAGQGLIAGANASLKLLGKPPLILSRHESYIGVLIEDLVSNCRDEPYRLFTARSENRLYIREDNTLLRMSPYRKALGLSKEIDQFQNECLFEAEILKDLIRELHLGEDLKKADIDPVDVLTELISKAGLRFHPTVIKAIAIGEKYEGYIERGNEEMEKMKKLLQRKINWEKIVQSTNVSFECRQRIKAVRPETFGQLKNIEGIRPATLAYIAGNLL